MPRNRNRIFGMNDLDGEPAEQNTCGLDKRPVEVRLTELDKILSFLSNDPMSYLQFMLAAQKARASLLCLLNEAGDNQELHKALRERAIIIHNLIAEAYLHVLSLKPEDHSYSNN